MDSKSFLIALNLESWTCLFDIILRLHDGDLTCLSLLEGGYRTYIYIYISVCVMSVSALFPFQRTITTINQQNSMNTLQIPTDSHIRAGIPGGLPYVYIYTHTYTDPLCFWPRLYGAGAALSVLPFCRFPRLAQWCQGRVSRGHGDLRNMGVPQ